MLLTEVRSLGRFQILYHASLSAVIVITPDMGILSLL